MKKFLKIMACAMMVIAMAGVISSCKKKNNESQNPNIDHTFTYYTFIDGLLSNSDIQKFSDYVYQKGGMRPYTMTGDFDTKEYTINAPSNEDCSAKADALAKADFDVVKGKLNVEEVQTLISVGTSFEYTLFRTTNTEQSIAVDAWECPAVPVPSEFGTLQIENSTFTITDRIKSGVQYSGTPGTFICLRDKDNNNFFSITIGNLETSGSVPVGHFEVEEGRCLMTVKYNGVQYQATSATCDITDEGKSFGFVASGQATKDDVTVDFNLNCTGVVF